MKKIITALSLMFSFHALAADTMSHSSVRAALGSGRSSLCALDLGEAKILSRNPVVVSYTYTLTHAGQSESIAFDQDRQTFDYSTDNATYEMISNTGGSNLSGKAKAFVVKFNDKSKIVEVRIGNLVCN